MREKEKNFLFFKKIKLRKGGEKVWKICLNKKALQLKWLLVVRLAMMVVRMIVRIVVGMVVQEHVTLVVVGTIVACFCKNNLLLCIMV